MLQQLDGVWTMEIDYIRAMTFDRLVFSDFLQSKARFVVVERFHGQASLDMVFWD